MSSITTYAQAPTRFIDRQIARDEKGRSLHLAPHQRAVIDAAFQWEMDLSGKVGRLLLSILLWGEMKKSGKTFLAAALVLWWAFTNPNTEIILAANDLDQSQGRVFKTVVQLLKHNPALMKSARILASEIQLSNGTIITAIASEYKGAAGSRHSLVVYDELWGFSLERAERLFEELTPPPTEDNAWVLIVTYAGWTGESALLERLYKRGLAGERIDEELELYRNDDLTMFWSHTPRQPWQTQRYYDSQRAILRPSTFARLHENRWVSSESSFITPELWDSCIDPDLTTTLPGNKTKAKYIGVDVGLKSDYAAVVVVERDGDRITLARYRLWKPSANNPLNLESTIEWYLRELCNTDLVHLILVDPWQAASSIQRLKAAGLPIQEFPQTVQGTTKMAQTMYDLLKGNNLRMFPDEELRQQAMNAVAIETPRGFRIAKEKASRKIDAIVALSMACVAAVDTPVYVPFGLVDVGHGCRSAEDIQTEADREHEERREAGVKWLADKVRENGCYFPGD